MAVEIKIIASSSEGNCYWINDGMTPLLLECGIRLQEIREGAGFRLSGLGGCLVSHEHLDHAKAVRDLLRMGVDCYMSWATKAALDLGPIHRLHLVEPLTEFLIGSWRIKPFKTIHNAAEPLGFLLVSGREKLLFATDTAFLPVAPISGLTHIMAECNYQARILYEGLLRGAISPGHKDRLLSSHMSLETLVKWLEANDLSALKETWLLHASDANSNVEEMVAAVSEVTGGETYVAEKRVKTGRG